MGSLFGLHFFLGMLLIGPVCLKIGSTVWRFARYYTGSAPYVGRGPPPTLQRVNVVEAVAISPRRSVTTARAGSSVIGSNDVLVALRFNAAIGMFSSAR